MKSCSNYFYIWFKKIDSSIYFICGLKYVSLFILEGRGGFMAIGNGVFNISISISDWGV